MDFTVPVDVKTQPFSSGDTVVLRSVRTFAAHGEAVGFSVAGLVLLDDENLAVVASPLGSAVRGRAGVGSGPNGRLVLPEGWDGSYIEDKWFGARVVHVHRESSRIFCHVLLGGKIEFRPRKCPVIVPLTGWLARRKGQRTIDRKLGSGVLELN